MNKIWQKATDNDSLVDQFTVGQDRELDLSLARFDVLGSMAHITMLESVGLLTSSELRTLLKGLKEILIEIDNGHFTIDDGVEDVHSQVEGLLTERLGDVGKKIHSGRSRNDQVLVDLKLYFRHEIHEIVAGTELLFNQLIALADQHKEKLMPGYTHLQLAMPSSFGLWFGAYAESLIDDLEVMLAAWKVSNKNPLGSAAGYGSSFPLNRKMTTELLGFENLNYNVVYAQMGRGKTERILAQGMASIAQTLAKMSMDVTLFLNQHFSFISFPDHLTTGSSIMPHKKNPDVFELIRARCNQLSALPNNIQMVTQNLPSGYHRDLQQIKEMLFSAIGELKSCLKMMHYMLENITVKDNLLADDKFKYLFSVEEVNRLVLSGVPFREAYVQVGLAIENGEFNPERKVDHSHEGSIGNLCLPEIQNAFMQVKKGFGFEKVEEALVKLADGDR
ncbi:argininosuccinate lyase [Marivirga sp. S37H4]|uniref:Argininosuccinate lyase n=1 Tax=Marivirga aurantiaca TaxID=2802615 RepID=A0A935C7H2_9BACT|nr:argininosuccinate lyase [Marivirga aurantiaca]MBK6264925.1 argininosuccinate lyase [Marivirga aurantiaca]